MHTNNKIKSRYDVLTYDGQTITAKTMTREQVMAINPQSVDYFFSTAFGTWGFRTAEDKWVEHNAADWPGLGDTCIRIIQAIQLNPEEAKAYAFKGSVKIYQGDNLGAIADSSKALQLDSTIQHAYLTRGA